MDRTSVESPDEAFRRTMPDIIHAEPSARPTWERFEPFRESPSDED